MFGKINQKKGGKVDVVTDQKDIRCADELHQEESGVTRFFTSDNPNALAGLARSVCESQSVAATPPGGEASCPAPLSDLPGPKLVVWITARAAELGVAEKVIAARYGITFSRRQTESGLHYREGKNAEWQFCLSFPRQQGPVDMGPHVVEVLTAKPAPYMAVMSGVCAGRRGGVALGDLIVAKSAFTMGVGGKVVVKEGKAQQRYATDMHGPHGSWSPVFEDLASSFDNWGEDMPLNKTYQQECYIRLCIEIEQQKKRGSEAPTNWFQETGYDINKNPRHNRDAIRQLLPSYPECVDCWELGDDGFFVPPKEMYDRVLRKLLVDDYPPKPRGPKCHYVPVLTDVSVRADDAHAFEEASNVHRDTDGLEMEASVFYRQCRDKLDKTPVLVTKGVVDHADMDKDNQFHAYGNQAAAVFLLDAIEHVSTIVRDSA